MKLPLLAFFITILVLGSALPVTAAVSLRDRLAGRILLDVDSHGAAWYVSPVTRERYSLGRPAEALSVMRELGLGIADADLAAIAEPNVSATPSKTAARLSGRLLLAVQQHGEAWYVNPVDLRRYYLGRPTDALAVMRLLGLGITAADLALIPAAQPPLAGATYVSRAVITPVGTFTAKVASFDRASFQIRTVTADGQDCGGGCAAVPLLRHYQAVTGAVAAIHGSYFCPPDYADCAGKAYSFLWPALDGLTGKVTNEGNLKYHERPLVTATADGGLHLYRNAKLDFGYSVAAHEAATGERVTALLGNYPTLVAGGRNVVGEETTLDAKMLTGRGLRGAVGWNADKLFLVIVSGATVPETAAVMATLGATDAMNLDGGGSAALVWRGEYKAGPGRLLPNAIVIVPR